MQLVDRIVAAIAAAEPSVGDRRRLILMGSQAAVDLLKEQPGARSLWQDVPPCFEGHPTIRGAFARVPVSAVNIPSIAEMSFVLINPATPKLCAVIAQFEEVQP